MAYHRHDAPGETSQYHGTAGEQGYISSGYHSDAKDPFSAEYNTGAGSKEEDEMSDFEKQIEEEQKSKYQKDSEGDTNQKAAEEISHEWSPQEKATEKKFSKSIEDAIEKAIKEEKQIIHLD